VLKLLYSTYSSGFEAEHAGVLYGDTFQVQGGECRVVCLASRISSGSGVSVTLTPEALKEDYRVAYNQLRSMGIAVVKVVGEWHSHPPNYLEPSPGDLDTIRTMLNVFHAMTGFLCVVVSECDGGINATTRLLRREAGGFVPQIVSSDTALEFIR
jgi:proteasome lid subunit RPN8/RPN11